MDLINLCAGSGDAMLIWPYYRVDLLTRELDSGIRHATTLYQFLLSP